MKPMSAREFQLDTACPDTRLLVEHVTSKWGVLVLLTLDDQTMRWSELKRSIAGVSEKMLIQTLQTLEADGLVRRDARPVVPPHVEYSLTADGREATALLAPLVYWAQRRASATYGDAPPAAGDSSSAADFSRAAGSRSRTGSPGRSR